MKRFWKTATSRPSGNGYTISLDEREMKTPLKASLVVPTQAYANGIIAEWDAVEEGAEIAPLTMHCTRAANATIDSVIEKREAVANMLSEYGGTDLICYRADTPVELVKRQAAAWDPLLGWAEKLGAPLETAAGVMFVQQPENSLKNLRDIVHDFDAWRLTALHDLVTISGSLIIGLAVAKGHLTGVNAWPLSRVDEDWQVEQWGEDEDAKAAADIKRDDFLRAELLLSLLDQD